MDPDARAIENRWLAESIRAALREARSFAVTAARVTVRPARFASEWARGERAAMNPMGYFATSAALVAICHKAAHALAGRETGGGLGIELLNAVGPYLQYAALGLLSHAMLRLRGSRRTVLGSLAVSLYVGGGPGALVTIINLAMFALAQLVFGKANFSGAELASPQLLVIAFVVFSSRLAVLVIFVRAFAGAHAVATGWAALALVIAVLVTGLAFGLLDPPGNYGGHLIIGSQQADGDRVWWPSYGF